MSLKEIDCLVIFARLLGYVRYFHPSDQAAEINWEEVAITGVQTVETAKDSTVLIEKLKAIFATIAPTVSIFATDESLALSPTLESDNLDSLQLVTWEHYGVRGEIAENKNIYHSKRVYHQITDELITNYQPYKADLGNGVSCIIPLALSVRDGKTLPHIPQTETTNPINHSLSDRHTRLAAIILAWNVWQHFYPYFDVVAVDWLEELKTALKSAATDKSAIDFDRTLRCLVAKLEDGHGFVYAPNPKSDRFLPAFSWDWVEDNLVITHILPDSEIDLIPGDIVLRINGRSAIEVISDRELFI